MTNKNRYIRFYKSNELPIYFAPWWMDIVCGANCWDVIVDVNNDNRVQGLLIYFLKRKYGLEYITMPKLTPYSGLWLNYPKGQFNHSKIAYENRTIKNIIIKLPNVSFYYQQHLPRVKNWLSFMWNGFTQRTSYTYVLKDIKNLESCYSNLKGSTRTDIKKAQQKISVQEIKSFNSFKTFIRSSFSKRNMKNPYDLELLEKLDKPLRSKNLRFILGAYENNELIAVSYIIIDKISAYYVASSFDPNYKSSAPMALLLWESIKKASLSVKKFDFEGSTIQGIEHFIRSFGGELTPHYQLIKARNFILKNILLKYLNY